MNIDEIIAELAEPSEKEEVKQATASPAPTAKVAHKTAQTPKKEAKKGTEKNTRIIDALKWAAVFGGLFAVIAYWKYTGQMADTAAVPSLCVTAALFGYGIGKYGAK